MDEHEKLNRVMLGALFSVANGIHVGFTPQESLDLIAFLADIVARKMDIDVSSPSQVIRLREECGMFICEEIIAV